jgi:hypothetical protein
MCVHYEFLPRDKERLLRAVSAASIGTRVNGEIDVARFQKEFAQELAWLIWDFGAKPVFRSLVALQEEIGLPCGISYLEEAGLILPSNVDEVDDCIDYTVIFRSTSVKTYIKTGHGLDEPCRIPLTSKVSARLPKKEAQRIIQQRRHAIETMREIHDPQAA